MLAQACADMGAPVVCVLGNHDKIWDRGTAVAAALREAGAIVLDPGTHVLEIDGRTVGIAGASGSGGGFGGRGRWGLGNGLDRNLRRNAAAASRELEGGWPRSRAARSGSRSFTTPPRSTRSWASGPTSGRRWGSDQLATPIHRHRPNLVIHAHDGARRTGAWARSRY